MPEVHDIGKKTFVHGMRYPTRRFPLVDRGQTTEIEYPYRAGASLVFRVPLSTRAVVLGRWTEQQDEETALRGAIGWREIDVQA